MKTRIIVAVLGIPLLLALIFFAPLWVFAIVVGVVSAVAAWELLRCTSPDAPVRLRGYAMVAAFIMPNIYAFKMYAQSRIVLYSVPPEVYPFVQGSTVLSISAYLLTFIIFFEVIISFRRKEPIKIETVFQVVFAGIVMPLMLSALVRMGAREDSSVYLLLPFVAAFSSDSGGYFVGKFLGKRKAFPNLSPNKTVEGCIGGLVSAIAVMLLYGLVLTLSGYEVSYLALALYGLLGSVACQIGDLAFSAVKRQYNIKDYGTLIPGHGGVLDRFDSMHFTAPMIELLVLLLPAAIK